VSKELVQLVEKGYEAWNAGDRGWVLDHMSEDIEWITPEDDRTPIPTTATEASRSIGPSGAPPSAS
jgi:ketosteroid isomerase-like protein